MAPACRNRLRRCLLAIHSAIFFLAAGSIPLQAAELGPLRIFLSPPDRPAGRGEAECDQHGGPQASGGYGRKKVLSVQESEHQPVPVRTYYFTDPQRLAQVKAIVRRPNGEVIEPELSLGADPSLSFKTPFGNGPTHGAHNVYLVEEGVDDSVLTIRTAKWITMHHNCGWGHNQKFNEQLTQPQPLAAIPFEIVIADLWDKNFHSKVTAGQQLMLTVLSYGKPVPNASVRIASEKGWVKEALTGPDGTISLQLIRDYYPMSWNDFDRTRRAEFLVTAQYDALTKGTLDQMAYDRIHYISTHGWHYTPSSSDYSSYAAGLLIMGGTMTMGGLGIHLYRDRRKRPYQRIVFDE